MNKMTEKITLYNNQNSGITWNNITSLAFFQEKLWIGTYRGGLISYDGSNWTVYNSDNSGLPYDMINCLETDGETLCIGMFASFASFDGTDWTSYRSAHSDLPGSVYDLAVDNHSAWAATPRGLACLTGSNWHVYTTSNSSLPCNNITSLDYNDNELWIGTLNEGITLYDGTNWTVYDTLNSGLPDDCISAVSLIEDTLWVGTQSNGLASFDGTSWTVYNTTNSHLPEGKVNTIVKANERIWAGTLYGLAFLNGANWNYTNISSSGLPQYIVNAIAVQGNKVWMGTFNGLASFDGSNWVIYKTSNSDLPHDHVTSLAVDGNLLIVGTEGGGLASYDGRNWITYIKYNPGLPHTKTILPNGGELWVGTSGAGLLRLNSTGLTIYDESNSGLPNNIVASLALDGDTLWVGTYDGFASFDGSAWQAYDINPYFEMPHEGRTIISILVDDDKLWLGTATAGLALFDGSSVTDIYLPYHRICSLLKYNNKLWAATWGGVSCYNGVSWDTYDITNSGLTINRTRCITQDEEGLWIGTFDGVVNYKMGSSSISTPTVSEEYSLTQNYPNPFNPSTKIAYAIPEASDVKLSIYDISGHLVETLVDGYHMPGAYTATWNASQYSSGIYIYRLENSYTTISRKMVLIK